ncbi:unnamed protein product [Polarella glacialis]|uniref:Uncharacterized protein n=1 Tax=Polarella glacialis TaxID=89957 RepID=A0A813HW00_POLGL|nr:unnamed protein product [Polarella glacialis]
MEQTTVVCCRSLCFACCFHLVYIFVVIPIVLLVVFILFTVGWLNPEVPYDEKADIYSFGVPALDLRCWSCQTNKQANKRTHNKHQTTTTPTTFILLACPP